jgi:hypothetical protein
MRGAHDILKFDKERDVVLIAHSGMLEYMHLKELAEEDLEALTYDYPVHEVQHPAWHETGIPCGVQRMALDVDVYADVEEWVAELLVELFPDLRELLLVVRAPGWRKQTPLEFVRVLKDQLLETPLRLSPEFKIKATAAGWEAAITKRLKNLRGICCKEMHRRRRDGFMDAMYRHRNKLDKEALQEVEELEEPLAADQVPRDEVPQQLRHREGTCRVGWTPPKVLIVEFKRKVPLDRVLQVE